MLSLQPEARLRRAAQLPRHVSCESKSIAAGGSSRFPIYTRRVAPQIFQAVERAFIAMEDVHHHLQIIEHDPLTRGKSVDCDRANNVIFPQVRLNFVRDSL
jgi:hypothetical protein